MRVEELKIFGPNKVGQLVNVEGWLVVKGGDCYITDIDSNERDYTLSMSIVCPDLERKLYRMVPAYGGGSFSYYHKVSIEGEVSNVNGNIELSNLTYLMCEIDEHRFIVIS